MTRMILQLQCSRDCAIVRLMLQTTLSIRTQADDDRIGISHKTMHTEFNAECIYQAELDVHFPELTVGQTLAFAAEITAPDNRHPAMYARCLSQVAIDTFNLSQAVETKLGNDMIRGVSGGERKRVSMAEAFIKGSVFQCWDNSTRGLDSSTALDFIKTLRLSTSVAKSTAAVSVYQASQAIYDVRPTSPARMPSEVFTDPITAI